MSELSNWVAQVERERDEARAEKEKAEFSARQFCSAHIGKQFLACPACELSEVRHIVTETLPDLADQPDRETTVRRVAALATRYQYERDAAALLRKDVDRWEATSQAQAIEEHKLRAEVERLRAAAPTVQTVDAEAVVRRIEARYIGAARGDARDREYDALRVIVQEATRPVSVESVAQALYESAAPRTVHDWPLASGVTKETYIVQARAALRVIGARLAENTGTGAPVSTQHPKDAHGYEKRGHIRGPDERQASDGSGDGGEGRVPRADAAGDLGGEGMQAPGCEPGEAARGPQGDGSRPALDCHRADALPGGPDGCGSRGDATGVLLTRVAALESALRLETDLRVHGDAVIGARLNLLIKAAPDVGAGLAEPVEPRPEPAQLPVCARCGRFACACGCEPAKVRVKLPRFAVMARHEIVTALRSQGVEVEE